jgi:hypothetical protein
MYLHSKHIIYTQSQPVFALNFHPLVPVFNAVVNILFSSVVDHGSSHVEVIPDYKSGICCFSLKHVALRFKSKDWLALSVDNVF